MIAAICDDEALFREKMSTILVEYKRLHRIHMDIVEFSNGQELLEYDEHCDIVFLDYDMPSLNGLEVAKILRNKRNHCCIVFVTSFGQYVYDSFEVNTYRYLIKPVEFPIISRVLDNYIREKKMLSPIMIAVDGELITINSEDILYLEADGKYCNIRTLKNIFHSSKTLSKVFELLPQHCFFRTHKSYVVNLHSISSIKEDIIEFSNGERAKISRTQLNSFKNAYKDFIKHFVLESY